MKLRSYSGEGIILDKKNFSEADKIFTVFTNHNGKISLIAKGVRRTKSRKRGHLEVFNYIKFHATFSKDMGLMTEAEVIDDFKEIRSSLNKISLAYYFVEVIKKITQDNEPNLNLFKLMIKFLERLKTTTSLKKLRTEFATTVLIEMGYWPEGKEVLDIDSVLEEVVERTLSSVRVGKLISS